MLSLENVVSIELVEFPTSKKPAMIGNLKVTVVRLEDDNKVIESAIVPVKDAVKFYKTARPLFKFPARTSEKTRKDGKVWRRSAKLSHNYTR